jgi:hypothetical protein
LWSEKVMEKLWDFVGTLLKHHCLIWNWLHNNFISSNFSIHTHLQQKDSFTESWKNSQNNGIFSNTRNQKYCFFIYLMSYWNFSYYIVPVVSTVRNLTYIVLLQYVSLSCYF